VLTDTAGGEQYIEPSVGNGDYRPLFSQLAVFERSLASDDALDVIRQRLVPHLEYRHIWHQPLFRSKTVRPLLFLYVCACFHCGFSRSQSW
jgi:hypothetical protein